MLKSRCSWLLLIVVALLSPISLAVGGKLSLAATEWPPYTGSSLTNGGLADEIVSAAFERVGYEVEFVVRPWGRAQQMVDDGTLDGMGIAWHTPERAEKMLYSQPFIFNEIVLLKHRDDQGNYRQMSDYNHKHFGVLRGYGYLNLVKSDTIRKTVLNKLEQSLLMLSLKRIDLTLEEKLNAQHQLSLMPQEVQQAVIVVPQPLEVKPLHITISRKRGNHRQIIEDFNRGLALIVEEGIYTKIIERHGPHPRGITLP